LTQEEFKSEWLKKFPVLFDTKYMISNSHVMANEINGLSNLQTCYEAMVKYDEKTPFIKMRDEFNRYSIKNSQESFFSHEAGFDAFMTGYVFFKMLSLQSFRYYLSSILTEIFRFRLFSSK
jgi:CAF1 family ribonuclease